MEMSEKNCSSSDSDSVVTEDEIDNSSALKPGNREKRKTKSCVYISKPNNRCGEVKVTWPPSTANWRQLRHVRPGNPYYGTKMQLYSKTNHHLAIYPDGQVRGTQDDTDLHTLLEVVSAGYSGHVRIKGLLTNLYVAMDNKGRLYADNSMDENSVFIEAFQGSYNTYLSRKYAHLGWYIGIKKSGKFKKGPKTKYGQKAIMFLPRRSHFQ